MTGPEPVKVCRSVSPVRDGAAAAALLQALEGVLAVEPGGTRLRVTYDLRHLHYGGLVAPLRAAGLLPEPGLAARLRTGWYAYLDRNLSDTMAAKGGACCSDPREVYLRRRGR